MIGLRREAAAAIVALAAGGALALAQDDARPVDEDAPARVEASGAPDDVARARLLGALVYTRVELPSEETSARDAFARLRAALGVPLVVRYADDRVGHGIEPETRVRLAGVATPALDALEDLVDQCQRTSGPCSWQLRRGFVEVGTKRRLAAPAARETRAYYIGDLIIDIPENPGQRTRRELIALDVVADVVENVEPNAWDYGQPLDDVEPDLLYRVRTDAAGPGTAGGADPEPAEVPTGAPVAREARYVLPRKIAIIRYWRDLLIIHAPDYIHRQVGGYPDPIPPAGARADTGAGRGYGALERLRSNTNSGDVK